MEENISQCVNGNVYFTFLQQEQKLHYFQSFKFLTENKQNVYKQSKVRTVLISPYQFIILSGFNFHGEIVRSRLVNVEFGQFILFLFRLQACLSNNLVNLCGQFLL